MSAGDTSSRFLPLLKVGYLVLVGVAAFAAPPVCDAFRAGSASAYYAVGGLLAMQLLLLLGNGIGGRQIYAGCARVRWLFVFLIGFSLLPGAVEGLRALGGGDATAMEEATLRMVKDGAAAFLMCMQVATMVLVSLLVQATGSPTDFVDGLRKLRLPKLFVYSLDNTLALIGGIDRRAGGGQGGGGGGGNRRGCLASENGGSAVQETVGQLAALEHQAGAEKDNDPPGLKAILKRLLRGDVGFFVDAIRAGQRSAQARLKANAGPTLTARQVHDVTVVSGIALLMVSIKILKILPGVPFASGFKTVLLIPLYIVASRQTHTRWGGTLAGSIMGIIGLMMGDGADAFFEVLKHLVPGFAIDLLWPLVGRLPGSRLVYCVLGFVVGLVRVVMDPKVALILAPALSTGKIWQNPALLLSVAPKVLFTLFFGALSGLVTFYALRAFGRSEVRGALEAVASPERPVPAGEVAVASQTDATAEPAAMGTGE